MASSSPGLHPRLARGLAALALLAAAPTAQAQGMPTRAERADPLDAQARVPAVIYRSPLASYRPLVDDKPTAWKQANETVNRIGGWRAYTREAQQPDAAPGTAPSHDGHRMPGGTR